MSTRFFISPCTPRDSSRSSSSCTAATGPPPSRSPSTAAAGPPPTAGAAGAAVDVSAAREGGSDSEDSGGDEDSVDTSVASVKAVTSVMESLDAGAELGSPTASADTTEAAEVEAWEDSEAALEADNEPSRAAVTGDDASDPETEEKVSGDDDEDES